MKNPIEMTDIKTKSGVVYRVSHDAYVSIENELDKISVDMPQQEKDQLKMLCRDCMIGAFKDGCDYAYGEIGL